MNVTEGFKWTDLDADSPDFTVRGGKYLFAVYSATFGSDPVGIAAKDDAGNYAPVVCLSTDGGNAGVTGEAGSAVMDLPPGTYKLDAGDSSNIKAALVAVPY